MAVFFMHIHVTIEIAASQERLTTDLTTELPLSLVLDHMQAKEIIVEKLLITHGARHVFLLNASALYGLS